MKKIRLIVILLNSVPEDEVIGNIDYKEKQTLNPRFPSASRLAWRAALEKRIVKLDLLTDIDMVLMVEKCFGAEYVMLFIDM